MVRFFGSGSVIEAKIMCLHSRLKTLTVDRERSLLIIRPSMMTLGIQTYFADPYASWQHGSNENYNSLLRQYIPKKNVTYLLLRYDA